MATVEDITSAIAGETVSARFATTVAERPDAVALRRRDGDGWLEWTWAAYGDQAARLAGALGALGVRRGSRVVLMMRNRPEFHVADVAVLLCGATPISIYNSSAPDQIRYLAGHCEASVAILEDEGFLELMLSVRDDLPALREVAVLDGAPARGVLDFAELLGHEPVDLDAASRIAQPDDLATVIYTSGTTGPPKGVMIDHANVTWTVESLRRAAGEIDLTGSRFVSYLPMAHIAERMTSHYQGIRLGYEVTTCPETGVLPKYLPEVRPEVFFAVPRVWEKLRAGVLAAAGADPAQSAALESALAVGARVAEHRARREALPAELEAEAATAEPVLGFVRSLLGLDAVRVAVSAAAPIPQNVLAFFRALGVELSELYGLSETSGPMTWAPFRVRIGTVGPPIPGCEVALAEDGEVICRGGNVFRGYLKDPERTAEAIDEQGWFHSGDVGELDDDGYLRIVDRKKELIITAGGKNISPANLEAALKAFPLIGQACVIGDGRPFVSALIVLDPEVAPAWAAAHGIDVTDPVELASHPEVRAEIERNVEAANAQFAHVEQVKRFRLLGEEWVPDSEELTPTMKLKRRGVHTKYAAEIEEIYTRS